MKNREENEECCSGFLRWFLTNETCAPCQRWAMFVLRVALGVMFIFPGIGKLMDFDKAVGAAAERGF